MLFVFPKGIGKESDMHWIKDKDGDYVNLENMISIVVTDRGDDYNNPFEVRVNSMTEFYILDTFKFEEQARTYVDRILENRTIQ